MLAAAETEVHPFYPLNEFYDKSGIPIPNVVQVYGEQVPEPYRSLLVHKNDMTPTLESAYGTDVALRVMEFDLSGDVLSRRILLFAEGREKPVVFGSIKIYLDRFSELARQQVEEQRLPLGAILRGQAIIHSSCPSAFFKVTADAVIKQALGLSGEAVLYGRRNVLSDSSNRTLAQVIEILPPSEQQ